jgi:hypothetical protein
MNDDSMSRIRPFADYCPVRPNPAIISLMQWKSAHTALIEGEINRLERQVRLLDRVGLSRLAEQADDKITVLLNQIPGHPPEAKNIVG